MLQFSYFIHGYSAKIVSRPEEISQMKMLSTKNKSYHTIELNLFLRERFLCVYLKTHDFMNVMIIEQIHTLVNT